MCIRDRSEIISSETADLSEQDKQGIQFIQENQSISVSDYANEFKIATKTAQRRLSDLVEKGLIIKEGERRWTRYRIKE